MKYKAGDKVKVRNDLKGGDCYGTEYFNEDMEKYKGQTVTIEAVRSDVYYIQEDEETFYWTDEMFEDKNIDRFEWLSNTVNELLTNPKVIYQELGKIVTKRGEEIEKLQKENNELKTENNYLKGQVEAYKNILTTKE